MNPLPFKPMIMKNEFTKLAQANPTLKHDPFVRAMIQKESRQAEQYKMHCMNQYPSRSGWITLLQNRVNLNSVGNVRYKTKVYFDHRTKMVGESPENCNTPFRCARLSNSQPAAGWMES